MLPSQGRNTGSNPVGAIMKRNGFSLIEFLIVIVIVGILVGFGFPRLRKTIPSIAVRSARTEFGNTASVAYSTAVARGCKASFHFTTGPQATVWVVSCSVKGNGSDSVVSNFDSIAARYNVSLSAVNTNVIVFSPLGYTYTLQPVTVVFTSNSSWQTPVVDSVVINAIGKRIY